MKLSTEVKYLSNRKNLFFTVFSLILIISWMFICEKIDRENDRGLLTIFGYCCIFPFIIVSFFSNNKVTDFFTLFIALGVSCLIVLLAIMLGLLISVVVGPVGIAVPLFAVGFLIFYCIRLVVSFPDNRMAFWIMTTLPIVIAVMIYALDKYKSELHDYGIGLPISIYLSLLILSITFLCKEKNEKEVEEL